MKGKGWGGWWGTGGCWVWFTYSQSTLFRAALELDWVCLCAGISTSPVWEVFRKVRICV